MKDERSGGAPPVVLSPEVRERIEKVLYGYTCESCAQGEREAGEVNGRITLLPAWDEGAAPPT